MAQTVSTRCVVHDRECVSPDCYCMRCGDVVALGVPVFTNEPPSSLWSGLVYVVTNTGCLVSTFSTLHLVVVAIQYNRLSNR